MNNYEKTKKIVITGASGFLGSNLAAAFENDERYFVYALSSKGDELQKHNVCKNIRYFHKDAIFTDEGDQILNDAIAVNCAFPRNSTGTGMADGLKYIGRLFDMAKERSVKAIINISSQSVYSPAREAAAAEETPVCLESAYAVGKYASELMLESVCRGTEIAYTNIRMASLIGPGFDQRIVNRFVKQAIQGKQLHVIKSEQRFGFLDVADAVRAVTALLNVDYSGWKPIYNAGNAQGYTIEELACCIEKVFYENHLTFPAVCTENGFEKGCSAVDYHLLNADTGFEPTVNMCESIQRIMQEMLKA